MKKRPLFLKPSLFSVFILLFICVKNGQAETLLNGNHSFHYAFEKGHSIQVWYYKPEGFSVNSQILFVMHGTKRNALDYRNQWINYANAHSSLIIAPEFSEANFPGTQFYHYGNLLDAEQNIQGFEKTAYHLIDQLFLHIQSMTSSNQQRYDIYGHSAGGQFVHRLVLFGNTTRIRHAIAANSGWYTLPSNQITFPYGLNGSPVKEQDLNKALATSLVILLGEKDKDENHPYLRKTAEAMRQGKHRLARGKYFYAQGKALATTLNTPFNWRQIQIADAGHSNRLMSAAAQDLFGRIKSP